jgi:threonyl-tRNA synthetase
MKRIVKEEQPFERLEISKEDLLRLFGVRKNKQNLIILLFNFIFN